MELVGIYERKEIVNTGLQEHLWHLSTNINNFNHIYIYSS